VDGRPIRSFQDYFDALMSGNSARRRMMRFMPTDFKLIETRQPPLKDQYDEWRGRNHKSSGGKGVGMMLQIAQVHSDRRLDETSSMKAATTPYRKTAQVLLIASNGIGLALYLGFASLVWAPEGQEGLLGGPGDPLIWVMLALPWLVLCSFINLLAFRTVSARLILARQWLPALFLVLSGLGHSVRVRFKPTLRWECVEARNASTSRPLMRSSASPGLARQRCASSPGSTGYRFYRLGHHRRRDDHAADRGGWAHAGGA